MKERLAGVAMILCGAVLSYLCIYQPLESARNGDLQVSVSLKGALLAPIGLIGLLYLAIGPRATALFGSREKPTPAAYALAVVVLALGAGIYFWVRSTLEGYGYNFQGRL